MADPDEPGRVVDGELVDGKASTAREGEIEPAPQGAVERDDLPPVVSRLVVEIRSDGRKTMARGAMEDVATGQTVAISADARSLVELSTMLVQSLGQTVGAVVPRLGQRRETGRRSRLRSAAKTARKLLRRRK